MLGVVEVVAEREREKGIITANGMWFPNKPLNDGRATFRHRINLIKRKKNRSHSEQVEQTHTHTLIFPLAHQDKL